MIRIISAVIAMLFLTAATASAQDFPEDLGPEIGAQLPHALDLEDQSGAVRDLEGLSGENGLVLLFNRSLDWCPYCQNQTITINESASDIRARGYEIAVVTYDPVETLALFAERRDIDIALLSDPDSAAIDAFGLRNENYADNPKVYGVPHPVVFVVSPDGEIQAKLYQESYKDRPAIEAILDEIDALG